MGNGTRRWLFDSNYVECPLGHYIHQFLAFDVKSSCWSRGSYEWPVTPRLSSFTCANQMERVPYTLVCDHRRDCADGSDEDFCRFLPCRADQIKCESNNQCILKTRACDGWGDCQSGEDENQCLTAEVIYAKPILPPALVTLSSSGRLVVEPLETNLSVENPGTCPQTHFQCLNDGYCLPIFLRCNGVKDCPAREDEVSCDDCPGFYRCRASKVCLHHSYLCDSHGNCPQHDDELMCDTTCPPLCVCRGQSFFCRHPFTASEYPLLRYLDATSSAMSPAQLAENYLLIYLNLGNCHLRHLAGLRLQNLLVLDIQDNELSTISGLYLAGVPQLRELSLAGNPFTLVFEDVDEVRSFDSVVNLDLSRVRLHILNVTALSAFPKVQVVNLSHSGVKQIQGEGFGVVDQLRVIDVGGCPMTWFPRSMFHGLSRLQTVHAQSFRVCCPAVLPAHFNLHNCFAPPSNGISSCDDLLRGKGYTVCVFVLSFLALGGNSVSFIFRTYVTKRENKRGYGNFVTHLSVSDFLMGVYLSIIGAADQVYRGSYLWHDVAWRHSVVCKLAGFLSLLSSEVSALIMCLITVDRFLVLRFPFSRLRFSPASADVASAVVWIGCVLLVSVPLLPVTSHWEFYSQTGICIPLPITRTDFAGHEYSFSILIVFNFILFVLISMGQLSIYWSVRANTMCVSNTNKKTKDLTIARRLITVAMTDFLCWFPVGVLGLLASNGVPVPGEVNVAVAIFVLPLNSTINPCLYTVNVILERRSRARQEKLRALLLAQLKGGNS